MDGLTEDESVGGAGVLVGVGVLGVSEFGRIGVSAHQRVGVYLTCSCLISMRLMLEYTEGSNRCWCNEMAPAAKVDRPLSRTATSDDPLLALRAKHKGNIMPLYFATTF